MSFPLFTDKTLMPFGRHTGKALANIPASYFLYLDKVGCTHAGIQQYINDNREALVKEAKTERAWNDHLKR